MGGLAALARAAGHRVTGSDANIYPPMSTQLAAEGIELIDGYDPAQLDLKPDVVVVGNVMTRGKPIIERLLDSGMAYVSGPQWLAENVAARARGRGRRGHARQDDDLVHARLDPAGRGARSGLPDRRHPGELRCDRTGGRGRAVRDRGRRVRHRLLRQAREVRALPAAAPPADEPRIRPCGHLPGPGLDPAPVPPPRAHGAGLRPDHLELRQCRTEGDARDGRMDAAGRVRTSMPRPNGAHASSRRMAARSKCCIATHRSASCAGRSSACTTSRTASRRSPARPAPACCRPRPPRRSAASQA